MAVEELIQSTLEQSGVPVSRIQSESEADQYITWMMVLESGELYGDNEEMQRGFYVQVNIWSKTNYDALKDSVKSIMKAAGFLQRDDRDGPYSRETQYFNRVQRYFYSKEV